MKFSIEWTLSKILGYLIFIVGSIFAFYFHDSTVLISMTGIGAGLLGLKQWTDTQNNKTQKFNIYNKEPITPKPKEEVG